MLSQPVPLAGRVAPNRVLFGPHETNLGRDRGLSERHLAYYARRAAGGAGVIVTEIASVHDSDWPYERAPRAADCTGGWAAVVAACRPHGALVLAGLGHAGSQGSTDYHQATLWGPSPVADVTSREVPQELEQPEIDELVAGFRAAAALAVAADLDGVEINAGQHSILRQFLSGLTNHRVDGYGTDRARLLREVLAAVRAELGESRVLGLRLCCDELAPWAGITPDRGAAVAAEVSGWLDYLVPVRGSGLTAWATRPDLHVEPGFNRGLCALVRRAVPVPVVLQGSVVDPGFAQAALDDRVADLVEMTRAQITDPDLVALLRAGVPERIRPCTLSNQRSAVRDPRNFLVSDEAEPSAGYETADHPRRAGGGRPGPGECRDVLVVGGGPAGLEAARELALRGHRVRLAERSAVLGGALRLAAAGPGRAEFGNVVRDLLVECEGAEVRLRTGVWVDPALVDRERPDVVVLATGARPALPGWAAPGRGARRRVWDVREVLAGRVEPAGSVLVYDELGFQQAPAVAELLAARGCRVEIMTPALVVAQDLGTTLDMELFHRRAQAAGIVLTPERVVTGAITDPDGVSVTVLQHLTGIEARARYDWVVSVLPPQPEDALWRALAGRDDLAVHRIGDCLAPRRVPAAILDGHRIGVAL